MNTTTTKTKNEIDGEILEENETLIEGIGNLPEGMPQ